MCHGVIQISMMIIFLTCFWPDKIKNVLPAPYESAFLAHIEKFLGRESTPNVQSQHLDVSSDERASFNWINERMLSCLVIDFNELS